MMKCGRSRGNNTRPPFDGTKENCVMVKKREKKSAWSVITVGDNEMPINNGWSLFLMNFINGRLITVEKPQRLSIPTSHHVPDCPGRRRLLSVCFAPERRTQLSSRWKRKKKNISPKRRLRLTSLNCYWMDCPFMSSRFKQTGSGLKVRTHSISPNCLVASAGAKQLDWGMLVNKACGGNAGCVASCPFESYWKLPWWLSHEILLRFNVELQKLQRVEFSETSEAEGLMFGNRRRHLF